MNTFRTLAARAFALPLALPLVAILMAACDVDSVDSTTAVPSDNAGTIYNYSGLYMSDSNEEGSTNGYVPLVFPVGQQSGETVTWLRLLQYGSVLEAYDNANQTWDGSISAQNGSVASFSLRGKTTFGASVDVVGTLATASGSSTSTSGATQVASTEATMNATWIEPSFSGSIFAHATIAPAITSSPPPELEISPASASLDTNTYTQVFTANGGREPYSWSLASSDLGTLNSSSGKSVTYVSTHRTGVNTITVTDSNQATATATATYAGSSAGSVSISPTSVALSGESVSRTFTASGGTEPLEWRVDFPGLGTLNPSSGRSVTYTSTKTAGQNTITVTDANGSAAAATATYTASPGAALAISPSGTVGFNTNNFIRVFTASGGSGTYTWNVSSTTFGTLSGNSGNQVTYTSKFVAGNNVITVTDTDGHTASATAVYTP